MTELERVWSYTFDFGKSGMERGFAQSCGFDDGILIPFCPESNLSGVGNRDFFDMMWYHRTIQIPAEWRGKRIILRFGGVDYESEVFFDGTSVGRHSGWHFIVQPRYHTIRLSR